MPWWEDSTGQSNLFAAGTAPPRRVAVRPWHTDWPEAQRLAERLLDNLVAFEASEVLVELRTPLCRETLWFVPRLEHVAGLEAEGVNPGRIWTALELVTLLAAVDSRAGIQFAIRAKLFMNGEVQANARQV